MNYYFPLNNATCVSDPYSNEININNHPLTISNIFHQKIEYDYPVYNQENLDLSSLKKKFDSLVDDILSKSNTLVKNHFDQSNLKKKIQKEYDACQKELIVIEEKLKSNQEKQTKSNESLNQLQNQIKTENNKLNQLKNEIINKTKKLTILEKEIETKSKTIEK